jgi:hypothetical protein
MHTIVAAVLGLFVLGAGVVSSVHAANPCTRHTCRAQIEAACGSLSGGDHSACAKGVVGECKLGTISCVSSPSGAFLP